jgi:hypothetical protein
VTLIISAATQRFVVHASDRLLTKRIAGKVRVHSDVENKSLIVCCRDAIFVLGYTGTAYVERVITDEWLASRIAAKDLSGRFMSAAPGIGSVRLNAILRRIELGLRSAVLPLGAPYLGISVSGVRKRGNYIRPFIREFERNRSVCKADGYMRHPRSAHAHVISQIGDPVDDSQLRLTIGKEFGSHGISAEAFRRGMLKAIRAKAKVSAFVGDEVMTITIGRTPECWDVVWTFEAPAPRYGVLVGKDGQVSAPLDAFFSPWIITPALIMKPAVGNGHPDHDFGDIRIRCGNPPGNPVPAPGGGN